MQRLLLPPRCNKDLIDELIFFDQWDLFSQLDLVFFVTTSIYFEGHGRKNSGKRGFSKDHRADLNQMVVGAIIDDKAKPICCEMWPGNTADVKTLIPVIDRVGKGLTIRGEYKGHCGKIFQVVVVGLPPTIR